MDERIKQKLQTDIALLVQKERQLEDQIVELIAVLDKIKQQIVRIKLQINVQQNEIVTVSDDSD